MPQTKVSIKDNGNPKHPQIDVIDVPNKTIFKGEIGECESLYLKCGYIMAKGPRSVIVDLKTLALVDWRFEGDHPPKFCVNNYQPLKEIEIKIG